MGKIKVMDESLYNKINAGEVVLRVISVVKELVENSIDACSTDIKIELIDSGIKEIKVIDNGYGMDKDDAIKCFYPHASSKLIDEDDLFRISTLGFRGEALPSIASISNTTLITSNGVSNTKVDIKGGAVLSITEYSRDTGTTITVSNLFYNTPARLKHITNLNTELTNIINYINKISLAFPNIKFTLVNNDKLLFTTIGDNNTLKVINSIYSMEVTKNMIHITNSNDDYEIDGFISKGSISRSSKNHISIFVNNRLVKNYDINKCIIDAYKTYLMENRYPIIILNIKVDPALIDVNIHPTKMDIMFSKLDTLTELIKTTIYNTLRSNNMIPTDNKPKINDSFTYQKLDIDNVIRDIYDSNDTNEIVSNLFINEDSNAYSVSDVDNIYNIKTELEEKKANNIKMHPIGLLFGTYIICQNENLMYLIDQHAAKERINYENVYNSLGNPNKEIRQLLIPMKIELTLSEYIVFEEYKSIMEDMGFEISPFGVNTIIIKTCPTFIKEDNMIEVIKHMVYLIIEKKSNFNLSTFNDSIAKMVSCKMSIKANTMISINEMTILISDLFKCENPYNCPHGRPTIISFTKYEIEKMFKRIV